MIVTNLNNTERIEALHPLFKKLFDYVKTHDILNTPCGRIDIDGDNLYINNVNPECIPADYIDVQILLQGKETIGWKALEDSKEEVKPYEKDGDCALYSDTPTTWIHLVPGQLAIFFPEDAHAPVIGEGKIRKMIAKVKL